MTERPIKLYQAKTYPNQMSFNKINRMVKEVNYLDSQVRGLGDNLKAMKFSIVRFYEMHITISKIAAPIYAYGRNRGAIIVYNYLRCTCIKMFRFPVFRILYS